MTASTYADAFDADRQTRGWEVPKRREGFAQVVSANVLVGWIADFLISEVSFFLCGFWGRGGIVGYE